MAKKMTVSGVPPNEIDHASRTHAVLSASAAKRWLNCPPSARLNEQFPNVSSEFAEEGTAAHELCEYKVRKYLHDRMERPQSEYYTEEIEHATDIYAEFVIACGDSTKPETYEKLMDGEKANLLLTDPPYLVAYSNTSGSIKNDDLSDKEGYEFLKNAFACFKENLADDSAVYVFYATSKSRVFYDAFEDAGFRVSCGLVWRKDRLVLSRTDYQQNFEPVIYGWKKDGKHTWYGDRKQTTCFDFDRPKSSKAEGEGHPTAKPVPLMAYLIKQSTMTNGIVLDGFHGSGSTMIACEQLDRKCRAVELDEKFVDVQVKRYIKFREGKYDDVYVIRDGQKLTYEEALAAMPAEEDANG